MLFVLALCLLAGGAAFLVAWPGFAPRNVVVAGNRVVSTADILQRAAVSPHVNMWLQDTHAIASRVESIAYVDTARVRRIPPATVAIDVTERAPFALLGSGATIVVVDRSLRVLAQDAPVQTPDLPVFLVRPGLALTPGTFVTDASAAQLRDAYLAMLNAHVIATELRFDRYGGLIAVMRDGVEVMLGDGELDKKLPLVDPILAQITAKQRRVAAIDLRAPGTPVLVYR